MPELGIPFQLTEVDGVPCFWADAPGPCQAGLLFRTGRADERLAAGGITQLVARLALAGVGHRRGDYRPGLTATTTAFYGTGEPREIVAVLEHVCRALHDLPADGFESERRVLGIEAAREDPGTAQRLLMMRFGASGFGLPFYEPFGLRWLGPEHSSAWARERFTTGNAVLWMTQRPPDDLRLPLPPGPRPAPPPTEPMAGLELPAFAVSGEGALASTIVAERSTALAVASRVVADRAHQLGYRVEAWQFPLTADLAHRHLAVDCDEHDADEVLAGVLRVFDSVAEHGATPSELAEARANTLRALADDQAAPGALEQMAVDELLGAPRRWKEDLAAAAESPSYAEVAAALRSALATQIVLAPVHTTKPAGRGLADFPWFSRERIAGRELRAARGQRRPGEPDARLVVSQEGVSHVGDGAGHASTVKFADVAAAL
ncbi:MAG: zinc protease, partial [Thermoleophilales bacterium]|nr:zinc protease [Thermoleophilales bacterium]